MRAGPPLVIRFDHRRKERAMTTYTIEQAQSLPRWRRPETLLLLMAAGMPLAFATWMALLNNFVIEAAHFDGSDIGWLQSIREIPGFLSFAVIFLLLIWREQTLALLALALLSLGVMATGFFPTFWGLALTTFIGSVGFHYYETVNQSLQLQWIDKKHAPRTIGRIVAAGSFGSLIAYGAIVMTWDALGLSYKTVYLAGGALTLAITAFCWLAYPRFEAPHRQNKTMVLRGRYWLYYALVFMGGPRRHIFTLFAAFMMVERFGFDVHQVTALFLINYVANMLFAPVIGRMIQHWGERRALMLEYTGLIIVFLCYFGIYEFGWGLTLAAVLYVIDHMLFAMAFAQKTYFQKIADPADIAPTAAVAFTINHIAAVFLPAALGYLWLVSPAAVFALAASMAFVSLILSFLVPRHPEPGHESVLSPAQSPHLAR